ncbi:peroxiredoxin [Neomegalonema sp.]|uniref:peroxiredoxin n=1 Tax=Neomegalonema sp. TaxID=2039713 RepID=UPI00260310AB|nr:peroxiredoxin [Neomegalonema sp.]MDD2867052.1 peroxiredoxin [Neomegalonema sp.]
MAQIQEGERLPEATFTVMTAEGPKPVTTKEFFGGRKVAFFAAPGAFTPTCDKAHLPSYVANVEKFKAKGIDAVAGTTVNDVFVLDAWSKASGADGKVTLLADGSAAFAKAVGMDLDLTARGLGLRSKRYAMLVEDGVVKKLLVEDVPSEATCSTGGFLLDQI